MGVFKNYIRDLSKMGRLLEEKKLRVFVLLETVFFLNRLYSHGLCKYVMLKSQDSDSIIKNQGREIFKTSFSQVAPRASR